MLFLRLFNSHRSTIYFTEPSSQRSVLIRLGNNEDLLHKCRTDASKHVALSVELSHLFWGCIVDLSVDYRRTMYV